MINKIDGRLPTVFIRSRRFSSSARAIQRREDLSRNDLARLTKRG